MVSHGNTLKHFPRSRAYSQSSLRNEARLDRPKQRARTAADEVRRDHTSDGTWRLHQAPPRHYRTWTPRAGGSVCCVHCAMCSGKGTREQGQGMWACEHGHGEWAVCSLQSVFLQVTSLVCLQPAPRLRLCAFCCASAPLWTFFFLCLLHIRSTHSSDGTGPRAPIRNSKHLLQPNRFLCTQVQCSAVQCAVCLSAEPFCLQPLRLIPSVSVDAENAGELVFFRCLVIFCIEQWAAYG